MSPMMWAFFIACGAPGSSSGSSLGPTMSDTVSESPLDSGMPGTGTGHSGAFDSSSTDSGAGSSGGWLYDPHAFATHIEVSIDGVTTSKDLFYSPFGAGVAESEACASSTGISMFDDELDFIVQVWVEGTKTLLDTAHPQLPVDAFEYYPSLIVEDFDGRGRVVPSGGTWSVHLGPTETTLELRDASMCFVDELGKSAFSVDHADCTPTDLVEVRIVGVLGNASLDGLALPGMMLESGEPMCYVPFF